MAKTRNRKTALIIAICAIVLLLALTLALVFGGKNGTDEPEPIIVDGYTVMEYAAEFGVSIEFLQKIMPDYLVYAVGGTYEFQKLNPEIALHNYNLDLLYSTDSGRIYYHDSNYPDACYGIDVSAYQGDIDWQAVSMDNIDFALVRVGFRGYGEEGKLVLDENFKKNIEGAIAAGLDVGAYFFSQAITVEEAEEEANMLINAVQSYNITFPLIYDMEEIVGADARTKNMDKETATAIAAAFCKKISDAGYQPMIYGNTRWLAGRLHLEELKDIPLWFAQYYKKPLFPYDFDIWQYTHEGSVAGIAGAVDINICFKKSWQQ